MYPINSLSEISDKDMVGGSTDNLYTANQGSDKLLQLESSDSPSTFASSCSDKSHKTKDSVYSNFTSENRVYFSNDSPDFDLLYNGVIVLDAISIDSNLTIFTINATDTEGDAITFGIVPDMLPESSLILTDNQNGTASILFNSTTVSSGSHVFWIIVSDAENYQREPYAVVVP